jgi:hypothetical protein
MKPVSFIILILALSCSPLHQIHKIQSDKRIKKTEDRNFIGEKALTQWWYYDCVFEDGSVLVFLFTPYQWWDEAEKMPTGKSLFYCSYMNAKGEMTSQRKIFAATEVLYDKNSIQSPCFEISRAHRKNNRNYSINIFLDSIKGSVKISSESKAFSPFPRGSMSATITKLFKRRVKGLAYRYSAHVPQGTVNCKLEIQGKDLELAGKAYHEQGWFTGTPDKMGEGWTWFHFVSKNMNIFGTPGQFFCLEKEGKRLIGGIDKKCTLSEMSYSNTQKNLLTGGKLKFNSGKLSFELNPTGKQGTPLICLPSVDTQQLWGTVLQPTTIKLKYKKEELEEEGVMFLETCKMKK